MLARGPCAGSRGAVPRRLFAPLDVEAPPELVHTAPPPAWEMLCDAST